MNILKNKGSTQKFRNLLTETGEVNYSGKYNIFAKKSKK